MLKEALFGSQEDFTEGSLNRAILLLSIPMVLEMIMESLFGVVDVFFVARLGADAVATVGLTESLLSLVFAVAIGLSMTATAFVARRIGEKDHEGAADSAVQAILLGICLSVVIGAVGVWQAHNLLGFMGAGTGVIRNALYTRIVLGGSVVIFLLFLINAIFRGAGDAAISMRVLWLANAINIVLDPCLINGWGPFPKLGVLGAAVATMTGRGIGVGYQFWRLASPGSRIAIARRNVRFQPVVMLRLLRVSSTGILQFLVSTASYSGLIRIIATFGSDAVAGYTIALRMVIFTFLPSWGFGNAAATLVGQNLGARKPERAEKAVYITGFFNMLYILLVCVGLLFFPAQLMAIFTNDPNVARVGVQLLFIFGLTYPLFAWSMVMLQAFNGAGDTVTPTLVNLFALWLFQLPLAWVLGIWMGWGTRGVLSAVPIAEVVMTATVVTLFRRGKWKRQVI